MFKININTSKLISFVDTAHTSNLCKQRSTTGIVFNFMRGDIIYKSKTQSIIAGSSTEAEFIAAHSNAKLAQYLPILLKQLGYK